MDNTPIFYRHYDMRDRITQTATLPSFWIVEPMTTASPVYIAIIDDYGSLVKPRHEALAASFGNGYQEYRRGF